jgi:CheY-like chemotaxis protein
MKDSYSSLGNKPASALKQPYHILLVDDELDILRVLKRGLEAKGFEVDAFDSPQQAIDFFKSNVYDLAILDIRMPGLNGFALYRQMKKNRPLINGMLPISFRNASRGVQKGLSFNGG